MMSAVLSNPNHPEYGVATIPFPIPHDQYTYCMDLLEALEIGDAVKTDCKVVEFDSVYTVHSCNISANEFSDTIAENIDCVSCIFVSALSCIVQVTEVTG